MHMTRCSAHGWGLAPVHNNLLDMSGYIGHAWGSGLVMPVAWLQVLMQEHILYVAVLRARLQGELRAC